MVMTGFRTQTKTTDLPGKWGRAQIVTTQDRTVSRFPSIRVIAPPGCRGTFEPDNIPNDRNSENERNATRVHSQFVGHFEPKQPVFTKRDKQETGQQKSRVARFSAMPSSVPRISSDTKACTCMFSEDAGTRRWMCRVIEMRPTKVRIMAVNMCLLPAGINFSGRFLLDGNDRKEERLAALAALLDDYDIVLINELWGSIWSDHHKKFLSAASCKGFNIVKGKQTGSFV